MSTSKETLNSLQQLQEKQSSILKELRQLAPKRCCDNPAAVQADGEDPFDMTWASTLLAMEGAIEALDDLSATVQFSGPKRKPSVGWKDFLNQV